jgi:hypothetical protein
MEKRRAPRVGWTGEIVLSTLASQPVARGTIGNLSDGGILVVQVRDQDPLTLGQRLRFEFSVPDGEIQGSVEVARLEQGAEGREVGLRMLTITNDGGLHRLLGFLHRWLSGRA